jgi:hypothetical protein
MEKTKNPPRFLLFVGEKMNPAAAAAEVKQKPTWGLGSSGLLGTV